MLKLILVGCGAVADTLYKPALKHLSASGTARLAAAVDTDLSHARRFAAAFKATAYSSLDEALSRVQADAAIIATPHSTHAPLSARCLQAGLGVFCEKPMATTVEECDLMLEAAASADRPLVVGLFRRYFPSTKAVKRIIENKALGQVQSFDFLEGDRYGWPVQTASMFSRQLAGGGVLIDAGAHLVDLLLWWLGKPERMDYRDDAMGGVEANCELSLVMPGGINGRVRMSREYPLPNTYTISLEQGDLIYYCDVLDRLGIRDRGSGQVKDIDLHKMADLECCGLSAGDIAGSFDFMGCFTSLLKDFCKSVEGASCNVNNAYEAREEIAIIQESYDKRHFLGMPWLPETEQKAALALSEGKRHDTPDKPKVAVVGAGGFIGYRLCEWLVLNSKAQLTPVVHTARSLALLARFDTRPVFADVLKKETLVEAFKGKDIVFHTVVGERRTIVKGIENTLQAAKEAGIKRVVYMSTGCVYGNAIPSGIDEETPVLEAQPFAYNSAKVEAEKVVHRLRRELKLDVVMIRPLIVWGPRSQGWVVDVVRQFKQGTAYLVEGGQGICSTAYIDNLVEALWLAATLPEAANQGFNINDGEAVTWLQYYEGIKDILAFYREPWLNIPLAQAEREISAREKHENRQRLKTLHLRVAGKVIPGAWKPAIVKALRLSPPSHPGKHNGVVMLDRETVTLQLAEGRLTSQKAKDLIGYEARVSFSEGMERTARWLRFVEGERLGG